MTVLDENPTQEFEPIDLVDLTDTEEIPEIFWNPPEEIPESRKNSVIAVIVAGIAMVAAAFIWSATQPGAVNIPSQPGIFSSAVSVAPQGTGPITFPADGATVVVTVSTAAQRPAHTGQAVSVPIHVPPPSTAPASSRPAPVLTTSPAPPPPSPSPPDNSGSSGPTDSSSPIGSGSPTGTGSANDSASASSSDSADS